MNVQAADAFALVPDAGIGLGTQPSLVDVHNSVERQPRTQLLKNPLLFADASGPDIVRAHQKDAFHKKKLEDEFLDVCNTWLGQRFTLRQQKNLKLASGLMYFSLSSMRGLQTLGEEYCDIRQVDVLVGYYYGGILELGIGIANCYVE